MQYVNWGRFGPKEIFKDVPNHYLRDLLMDFINTDVAEEKREHTRKAVFSDLNTAEVLEYAALVARWRLDDDETDRKMQIIDGILGDRNPRTQNELFHIRDQAAVLDSIDVTIDMTPQPGFAFRSHNNHTLAGSVVKQNSKPKEYELELRVGTEIDRNCDQIRAMIKVFTLQGDWTVDQFRLAFGHISRSQLTTFMEKRGPREGIHTLAFELGWEFFKKRELLGVPNAPPLEHALENRRALQETDPNRGQKRSSIGGGDYPAKHAKVVGAGDTNVNLAA
ncbi:hypothetical protein F4821DRAFT_251508 [Hypoxylon rubiginosum]|uniref:Uncharacterized protein n=1 Tax=Hypoxylon rubiginosum TaxID=110542 RepID=A0ACC0CJ57_9PEZI|nr:hypothetical protein F4821DRAFT_251508 [Hypoxylon rubiginosum]